jgi:hypothetical protein
VQKLAEQERKLKQAFDDRVQVLVQSNNFEISKVGLFTHLHVIHLSCSFQSFTHSFA